MSVHKCPESGKGRPNRPDKSVKCGSIYSNGGRVDLCGYTCPRDAKGRPSWCDRNVFMWVHIPRS